jgi:non-haem Fe2+, alpha-ketoglutarate-dependent halogenase
MPITDALPDMQRELKFFPSENENPKKLTREEIQCYNKKGYIFPLDVFTAEEADANRRYFDGLMQKAKDAGLNNYSINGWHRHCCGLYDLLHEKRILDYVEDLLGPNLVSTMTHYFSKDPGDEKQVSWHQDASYWPLTPSKVVTVWLAIDDVDEENGPMTVIPGSHVRGQIPFEASAAEENNVLGQSVHDPAKWGGAPVPFTMKAGQISMHTDLLLHGSEPNRSQRRRCGLTLRYMPPDVRTREVEHGQGHICRGEDVSGYWVDGGKPEGDEMPK